MWKSVPHSARFDPAKKWLPHLSHLYSLNFFALFITVLKRASITFSTNYGYKNGAYIRYVGVKKQVEMNLNCTYLV